MKQGSYYLTKLVLASLVVISLPQVCHALTKDKQPLYDKYPQLVSEETDPCVHGLSQVLINMKTADAQESMVFSSMHGLNDLGSESGCENGSFGDLANFSTLTVNITHIPVALISGVCLPAECSQSDLSRFSMIITTQLNNLLIVAQKKLDIFDFDKGYGLVKSYSRVELSMDQSEQTAEDWRDSMRAGFICALLFISICVTLFCIAPNVYWLVLHFNVNGPGARISQGNTIERTQKLSMHVEDMDASPSSQKSGQNSHHIPQRATSVVTHKSVANSLFESRVTYKFQAQDHSGDQQIEDHVSLSSEKMDCKGKILSFSIVRAWTSLSSSKCKEWDDQELDVIEGVKFFSFFLGQLCLTAQFLMSTQTINPWMIQRFFQELVFTIVVSSNIVMEAFTTLSAFLGAYKLFSLYQAQGHLKVTDVLKFWARKYLRLAPMYYFIFFMGWAIFPYLGAGPVWYTAHAMYTDCDQYWWAQVLMIGNIVPYFQAPNYGCFFWGWTITTDLQLALLTPLFVLLYVKREWIGHLVTATMIIGDSILIVYMCLHYQLRVGPFAEENWYLFAYVFQKPFFKLHTFGAGITAAFWYMKILSFRRISEDRERKMRHPVIASMHESNLLHAVMFLLGFAIVLTTLLISHQAVAAPYSWSMAENAAYFGIARLGYVVGLYLMLFVFFTGGFTFGKAFMSRAIFRVLGKLAFESALITPMMVQLIYSQLPNGLFVQFNKVLELGLGNVVCVMTTSIFLYLLFEYPFAQLIKLYALPYLSHDDVHRRAYLRRQAKNYDRLSTQENCDTPFKPQDFGQNRSVSGGLGDRRVTARFIATGVEANKFGGDQQHQGKPLIVRDLDETEFEAGSSMYTNRLVRTQSVDNPNS